MASKTYTLTGTTRTEIVAHDMTVTALTRGGASNTLTLDNTLAYTQKFILDPKYTES